MNSTATKGNFTAQVYYEDMTQILTILQKPLSRWFREFKYFINYKYTML